MSDARPAPGSPRVLAGRYRLESLIARGGMAEVWKGTDAVLARPVAVKLLHTHLAADAGFRERFRREAVAAARLAHPNVVATFDTGEDGDEPFIVMELIGGRTLRDLLRERGALPPAVATGIAVQVADALAVAHDTGIVHRDVKPGNILVCTPSPGHDRSVPMVKVTDFGIARAAADGDGGDLTQPGSMLGSVKYLAPEQATGASADMRTDVYSLGVVLYEMLTGTPPFVGDTELATALAHLDRDPVRPRQLRPGIPRALEDLVMRAMARDPAARPESARAFASALRALDMADDDAVPLVERDATPPDGTPAAFRDSERTWLVPAALIVVVAVALVVLAVVLNRSSDGSGPAPAPSTAAAASPVAVVAAHSFDPRDGAEHEEDARFAVDGNPSTAWRTSTYATAAFGGLKDGVGLRLDLAAPATLRTLHVVSTSSGWAAAIYVSAAPVDRLEAWGKPVATRAGIDGTVDFDLHRTKGSSILIWITRLASDNRVQIDEVTVTA